MAVTKQEWEAVYEETLRLVEAFPLAERRMVNCKGIETMCLTPTVERDVELGRWSEKRIRRGWMADGDYETMHSAEEYCLWRDMIVEEEVVFNAGDALWGIIPWALNVGEGREDPRGKKILDIWGGKTQGEPYHMYLLAIACLIEDRLGEKAFVYGDITRGQCRKAVDLANGYLEKPIEIPARCDLARFKTRVSRLDISAWDQLRVFEEFYLGAKNAEFGEYMRKAYSTEVLDEYWRYEFGEFYRPGWIDEKVMNYLLWGFSLNKLCKLINFNDKENVPHYADFVKLIMDAKLHIKDKNCNDILKIDQEESTPYSIYTLFAQIMFRGAENRKVDRYIPIEEIKRDLAEGMGDRCDVEAIIEEYLQKERQEQKITVSKDTTSEELEELCKQDASETFSQLMERNRQSIIEDRIKYDVTEPEHFLYYECGDTISPGLLESLKGSFEFYTSTTQEVRYKELMEKSPSARCRWLIEQNRYITIRDCDWNKIFTDIETNEDSFARYYPVVRVKLDHMDLLYLAKALILNDAFYRYCEESIIKECKIIKT